MKYLLFFIITLCSVQCVFAQFPQLQQSFSPNPFQVKEGVAIFVDFQYATYKIGYDVSRKKTFYQATINFSNTMNGYPIFDVVKSPSRIMLDGVDIKSRPVVTPNQETTVRILSQPIYPGDHILYLEGEINENIEYQNGILRAGLWFDDQKDRSFLEKYLPTNLEYDQYAMKIQVYLVGVVGDHGIYTNGKLSSTEPGVVSIDFPSTFNASSVYLHIAPMSETTEVGAVYRSIVSRKEVPITIYAQMATQEQLKVAMDKTLFTLDQLEKALGIFPKDKLTIYLVPDDAGGVEHNGAIVSELKNLRHELLHQYLSKGFMPANGNAGWIDEAIVTWFDRNLPKTSAMKSNYNLAGQAYYTRKTDAKAYDHGVEFIGYLHQYLLTQRKNGLMPFLRFIAVNRINELYTTETFIADMERFYGMQLAWLFKKYVY